MPDSALSVDVKIARRDFSLEVRFEAPPGITILFGPSGAGKSTTLAAIAGLVHPTAGRVALGKDVWFDVGARIDRPVHERHVAFVFQSLALFPHMTAMANVTYGMERHLSAEEKRGRAIAMLERLRVGHLAERRPGTFSGGEAQRVALARAFAMTPRTVLLDEPFSAMDRDLRSDLVLDVKSFVRELAVPMIHVTHHRGEARALGDRAVLVEKGRVVRSGAVADVIGREEDAEMGVLPMERKRRGTS
jgi:molybdate transport system ATP-binding protein